MTKILLATLALLAGCTGASNTDTDGGPDAPGGGPAGWTCETRAYDDGLVCHCDCGAIDPDCQDPALIVSGCLFGEVCSTGTCSLCGNGEVDAGETCDPQAGGVAACGPLGYQPGDVPCNASCGWAYDQCLPLTTCGNGQLDGAELCDGTKIQPGRTCTSFGFATGSLACKPGCVLDASACHTCGDGSIDGPELCDDDDASGGDGCSAACTVEPGWQCGGEPSLCAPACGDGEVTGTEACDDGNTTSGDGCTSSCAIQANCTCAGEPSLCSCLTIETIDPTSLFPTFDTGALVVDALGKVHVAYSYGINYTEPDTNYSKEHAYAMYAERIGTTWSRSQILTWDQIQTSARPTDFRFVNDGGVLKLYFQRVYHPEGSFAVATRNAGLWSFSFDTFFHTQDVVRGGGAWHALAKPSQFGGQNYLGGAPGAWTRNEMVATESTRLAYSATGDVVAVKAQQSGIPGTTYTIEARRRVDATTWALDYSQITQAAGTTKVHAIDQWPVALPGGGIAILDEGFDCAGNRWLRAHRMPGATGPELVANLSVFNKNCSTSGGVSYSSINKVTAVDPQGRLHVLFASAGVGPSQTSSSVIDHYRDATGWKTRSLPLTNARALDMVIDATGTTHLLVLLPNSTMNGTRLAYVQVGPSSWPNP
ncbi:MAG: Multiple EGF-like-domain protein 3 precursor [Myxococcales bacterium]|nr:Multiple EGF-like-domain protein 3 precursor [Myxococcales bacterium]